MFVMLSNKESRCFILKKNIFSRVNLRQISSFILFQEETNTEIESYEQQLHKAKGLAHNALKNTSELGYSMSKDDLDEAFDIYQEVCTEIGMKLGARILFQLLHQNDSPEAKDPLK